MVIDEIVSSHLCMGCGLCSSVLGKDNCELDINEEGFYYPRLRHDVNDKIIKSICPGIVLHNQSTEEVWGKIFTIYKGWSNNSEIRYKASSGGVVTSLLLYLFETNKVDAVLQVGNSKENCLYNELKVSKSRNEIINNCGSRYAPAKSLNNIKQILDRDSSKYAFVGKPCDVAGIRNFVRAYPKYETRIRYVISIFCAGMPSYIASEVAWSQSGRTEMPSKLKYRGEGWPGTFKASWQDGHVFELNYNDSWGNILGKFLGFRCKICPDGIGLLADISVGDAWETRNGYPDFTESQGKSFIIIRNEIGDTALKEAMDKGYVKANEFPKEKIQEIQPYQYVKRRLVGWRILPIKLIHWRLLDFRGFFSLRQMMMINPITGIKNSLGTLKRYYYRNGK